MNDKSQVLVKAEDVLEGRELPEFINWLRKEIIRLNIENLQEAWLFGSAAESEKFNRYSSDIDLIFVIETDKHWAERILLVKELKTRLWRSDIIIYTPGEWARMQKNKESFYYLTAGHRFKLY